MTDKCKIMRSRVARVGDKCEGQVGDKCKIMRPRAPKVGEKCGKQLGDKCKSMRPRPPRAGDKHGRQVGETSVQSCGPDHPEWETRGRHMQNHAAQRTQSGRQVGDK